LLRIALEKHEVSVGWARRDHDFDWLRDDPRFAALLDEMGARSKEGNTIDRITEGETADGD
jgi:hypothetical protein